MRRPCSRPPLRALPRRRLCQPRWLHTRGCGVACARRPIGPEWWMVSLAQHTVVDPVGPQLAHAKAQQQSLWCRGVDMMGRPSITAQHRARDRTRTSLLAVRERRRQCGRAGTRQTPSAGVPLYETRAAVPRSGGFERHRRVPRASGLRTSDPAAVGRAPVDVAGLQVKAVLGRGGRADHVPTCRPPAIIEVRRQGCRPPCRAPPLRLGTPHPGGLQT